MTDERDDDDTPRVRDDNARHPIEHAAGAARRVGANFFRAFKDANSGGDPRRELRGLVEMMVLNIQDGEMTGREFARLPVHLPDDEAGMRRLSLSKVPADAELKAELYEWARGNRDTRDKATKALANLVGAYRRANTEILADEECTDAELGEWCDLLRSHAATVWKVDIREAPIAAVDIEAWASEAVGRFDVTPRFLTGEEHRNVFDPAAHRGGPAKNPMASNPARPFRAHVGDDD